jgi:hypothetical protein
MPSFTLLTVSPGEAGSTGRVRYSLMSRYSWRLQAAVMVVGGIGLLIGAGLSPIGRHLDLDTKPGRATGTVVGFVDLGGGGRNFVISFKTSSGDNVQFVQPWDVQVGLVYRYGQQVTVAYDPHAPTRAMTIGFWEWWSLPLFLAAFGFGSLIGGVLILRLTRRNPGEQKVAA